MHKDGKLDGASITVKKTADESLNQPAIAAIRDSARFDPMPLAVPRMSISESSSTTTCVHRRPVELLRIPLLSWMQKPF